jgi:hypothetical protein
MANLFQDIAWSIPLQRRKTGIRSPPGAAQNHLRR